MNTKQSCPADIELAAFFEGRLPAGDREGIERHLASHADCRIAAAVIRDALAADADVSGEVPERLVRKAVALHPANRGGFDLVVSLMKDALAVIGAAVDVKLSMPLSAATLRTRGRADIPMVIMTKRFDAVTAEVNIEKLRGDLCNIAVAVSGRMPGSDADGLRVTLASEKRELASSSLENGRVLFEDVQRGRYDIVLEQKGAACGIVAINIV